ncbi:MAG: hypothetical protein AB1665_04240, partial [Candidatus Thermoplasmatota archaeon]
SATNLEVVLVSIDGKYDRVMWYDASVPKWRQYNTEWSPILNTLWHLNHKMGFWLHVKEDCTLIAFGEPQTTTSIQLYAGWNMVGYPARNDTWYTVGDLKNDTGATFVEGFNASAPYLTSVLPDTYVLKKGEGYWVYVSAATTWTVNW